MSLISDVKTAYHIAFSPIKGGSHQERLESFYGRQAESYDEFRKRLLQGREPLFAKLAAKSSGKVWVDFGGGTGSNIELIGPHILDYDKIYIVDLSKSLLEQADERISRLQWQNVETQMHDATTFVPEEKKIDVASFSYSLTMIPEWFKAIDHAYEMLEPGGTIGVVDFYVSPKHTSENEIHHSWWSRHFWPTWFGFDNVHLSSDHLRYLRYKFEEIEVTENLAKVPFLPGMKVPYYTFVGCKK